MIWNETVECMDREQLREIQSIRLKKMAEYVYHNTPFYRKKFQEMGLEPGDIKDIDDIVKLPFTNKLDLRDNYPFGLAAVPMSQIVRIHASSGTTGKPVVVLHTRKDIAMWTEAISRAFTAYGASKDDIFQISYGYGLFTGGLGAHDGATNIGASVIPMSSGNTQKQITLMHDFGASVLCCTPSYAMFLGEALRECEWPRDEFKLKIGAFGAEPWTEEMRQKLESSLGIKAYDIYGLSEIAGPGVGFECECQHGTHLNEDYFYPEILNPETGEPMPEGQLGELTFTHLTKGRCDDMLIIRGVNVFPSQIESVILSLPEYEPHFLLTVDRVNNTDTSELKVEVKEEYFTDDMATMVGLQKKLEGELRSVIGLGFKIKLVEPKGIERSTGKAKRVIDNRKFQ